MLVRCKRQWETVGNFPQFTRVSKGRSGEFPSIYTCQLVPGGEFQKGSNRRIRYARFPRMPGCALRVSVFLAIIVVAVLPKIAGFNGSIMGNCSAGSIRLARLLAYLDTAYTFLCSGRWIALARNLARYEIFCNFSCAARQQKNPAFLPGLIAGFLISRNFSCKAA